MRCTYLLRILATSEALPDLKDSQKPDESKQVIETIETIKKKKKKVKYFPRREQSISVSPAWYDNNKAVSAS